MSVSGISAEVRKSITDAVTGAMDNIWDENSEIGSQPMNQLEALRKIQTAFAKAKWDWYKEAGETANYGLEKIKEVAQLGLNYGKGVVTAWDPNGK